MSIKPTAETAHLATGERLQWFCWCCGPRLINERLFYHVAFRKHMYNRTSHLAIIEYILCIIDLELTARNPLSCKVAYKSIIYARICRCGSLQAPRDAFSRLINQIHDACKIVVNKIFRVVEPCTTVQSIMSCSPRVLTRMGSQEAMFQIAGRAA